MAENKKAESPSDIIIEFKLKKPILSYGEQVSVLKIRKPTGADLVRVGNPVKFNPYVSPPSVEHDFTKLVAMVARLANVPSSSLEALDPEELTALAWELTNFFLPAM